MRAGVVWGGGGQRCPKMGQNSKLFIRDTDETFENERTNRGGGGPTPTILSVFLMLRNTGRCQVRNCHFQSEFLTKMWIGIPQDPPQSINTDEYY